VDEPTRGLDTLSKREVRQVIKTLNRETGITILFTTRDATEAEYLCDRMMIMDNGKIIFTETQQGSGKDTRIVNEAARHSDAGELAGENPL
jgi:ABC-2 type transport system ATP-binding protein